MGYVKKYVAEDRKRYLVVPCGKEKKDSKFSQRQRTWNKYQPYAYIEVDRLCHNLTAKKKNFAVQLSPSQTLKANNFCARGKKKFLLFFLLLFFFVLLRSKKTKDKRQKTKKKCVNFGFSAEKKKEGEKRVQN